MVGRPARSSDGRPVGRRGGGWMLSQAAGWSGPVAGRSDAVAASLTFGAPVYFMYRVFWGRRPATRAAFRRAAEKCRIEQLALITYPIGRVKHTSAASWSRKTWGLVVTRPRAASQVLERMVKLNEDTLKPMFKGMLAGLAHVHNQCVVHRDVKPDNFLCQACGEPACSARLTMLG